MSSNLLGVIRSDHYTGPITADDYEAICLVAYHMLEVVLYIFLSVFLFKYVSMLFCVNVYMHKMSTFVKAIEN